MIRWKMASLRIIGLRFGTVVGSQGPTRGKAKEKTLTIGLRAVP